MVVSFIPVYYSQYNTPCNNIHRTSKEWLDNWKIKKGYSNLENKLSESIVMMNDNNYSIRNKDFYETLNSLKELSEYYNPLPIEFIDTIGRLSTQSNYSSEQKRRLKKMNNLLQKIQRNSPTNFPPISNNALNIIRDLNENFNTNIVYNSFIREKLKSKFINLEGKNNLSTLLEKLCDYTNTIIRGDKFNRDCWHISERNNEKIISYNNLILISTDNYNHKKIEVYLDPNTGRFISIENAIKNPRINENIEISIQQQLPEWEIIESFITNDTPNHKINTTDNFEINRNNLIIKLIAALYPIKSKLTFSNGIDIGFQKGVVAHKEKNSNGNFNVEIKSVPFPELSEKIRNRSEFMYTRAAADATNFKFFDVNSIEIKSERISTTIVRQDIQWSFESEREPSYIQVKAYENIADLELLFDVRKIF